jgi:hypothetical protein
LVWSVKRRQTVGAHSPSLMRARRPRKDGEGEEKTDQPSSFYKAGGARARKVKGAERMSGGWVSRSCSHLQGEREREEREERE